MGASKPFARFNADCLGTDIKLKNAIAESHCVLDILAARHKQILQQWMIFTLMVSPFLIVDISYL